MSQGVYVLVAAGILTATVGCASSDAGLQLFNGKDMTGWKAKDPNHNAWLAASAVRPSAEDPTNFTITPGIGILVNGQTGKTSDLLTELEHGDCRAHIEFMVPKGSNSGVYFMGRYEIQVFDSFGKKDVTFSDCGGIYARWINEQNVDGVPPAVNASKAPGEWQTFDVIFRAPRFDGSGKKIENARFVEVRHNGKLIHKNVVLKGPTRAGMPGEEKPTGPLRLQGDHGPVAYRNLWIWRSGGH